MNAIMKTRDEDSFGLTSEDVNVISIFAQNMHGVSLEHLRKKLDDMHEVSEDARAVILTMLERVDDHGLVSAASLDASGERYKKVLEVVDYFF